MTTFVTLAGVPGYPMDPDGEIDDAVLRSDTTAGYEQTRPKFTRARRSWGVNYPDMIGADVALLKAFELTTLRNGADMFDWPHPITGTFTVRLKGPIKFAKDDFGGTRVSFALREV